MELNELDECPECGVVFNYTTASVKRNEEYPSQMYYVVTCPVCGYYYHNFV